MITFLTVASTYSNRHHTLSTMVTLQLILLTQIVVCIVSVRLGVLQNFSRMLVALEVLEAVSRSTQLLPLGSSIYQRLPRITSIRSLPALSRLLFHSTSSQNLSTLTSQHRLRGSQPPTPSHSTYIPSSIISAYLGIGLFLHVGKKRSLLLRDDHDWMYSVFQYCCRPHEHRAPSPSTVLLLA